MAGQSPLDVDFVQRVIDAALPEDQELEYKRELLKKITDPARAAQSKMDPVEELAKEVAAITIANRAGADFMLDSPFVRCSFPSQPGSAQ